MPWTSSHLQWLVDTGERLSTADGREVEVWNFCHQNDDAILSSWARHFRNHYCLDSDIDKYRGGTGLSRCDYLNSIKFPDPRAAPGPSIRAGDFGEILAADYLQYVLGFWVPRTQYSSKSIRNESHKGCDIIGFRFSRDGQESPRDTLAIFETKTQFSGYKAGPRLQDAVDGSAKDQTRKAESLNAIKQRLSDRSQRRDAELVERFQNREDHPFQEISGAAALFSSPLFDRESIQATNTDSHPNVANLILLVIHGNDMMRLVNELYRRAANEA